MKKLRWKEQNLAGFILSVQSKLQNAKHESSRRVWRNTYTHEIESGAFEAQN